MTTKVMYATFNHSSDVAFRAWGVELSAAFDTVGLSKTADTGQINWNTVTRPGINTAAGYEVRVLPGTNPLYLKIEFGTGSVATYPALFVTVGRSSNGTGSLTGQTSTRNQCSQNVAINSSVSKYSSLLCVTAEFFGLVWKIGAAATDSYGTLMIGKSCNTLGVSTDDAFFVQRRPVSGSVLASQTVRSISPATTYSESNNSMWVYPNYSAGSGIDTNTPSGLISMVPNYIAFPDVAPISQIVGYGSSVPRFHTTQTSVFLGATERTYLTLGSSVGIAEYNSTANSIAMLWE